MPEDITTNLVALFSRARERTHVLVAPLAAEDMVVQTMPDVSPTKWHLAHTTWFWEQFILCEHLNGYAVFDKKFSYLFNSYYEQVGDRHPRPERGFLSRPCLEEVMAYRRHVDEAMQLLLSGDHKVDFSVLADLVTLGVAHEEQHQELLLTDIKHVLSRHPFAPAAYPADPRRGAGAELKWLDVSGGVYAFGHEGEGFAFDNEGPRHEAVLTDFAIANRPVTNAEFRAFLEDGGYETASLWLSDGWARVRESGWRHPIYWRGNAQDGWREFTLSGDRPLDPEAPVSHLSYFEASAFAEWAGARLPEEREWELAARLHAGQKDRSLQPGQAPHPVPAMSGSGMVQVFGEVWQWTRSAYSAYPRFKIAPGAVGEYNGKFMCGQFVLRGGSCATPAGHSRQTYRNFFPPDARWQFSGLRLAKDI